MADFELQNEGARVHVTRADSLKNEKLCGRTYHLAVVSSKNPMLASEKKSESREDGDCAIFLRGLLDGYFNCGTQLNFHGEIFSERGVVDLTLFYLEKPKPKSADGQLERTRADFARWLLRYQQNVRCKLGPNEFGRLYEGLDGIIADGERDSD